MIKLRDVDKFVDSKYQRTFILKSIDLTIEQGEFVTIMGPSGAGKSTVMNIIGMLDEPSQGEYYFLDEPIHKMKERKRSELHKHHIGFVFQAYHLIDELTVYENIETPLLYKGVKSGERKALVAEMLDRFQMVAKKDLFPEQLSGGQQQLVGVARALIGQPKLLLADEPTGNLHSDQAEEIMKLFQKLNSEGMTIVQVTHSKENAAYGKRTINIVDGTIDSDSRH
ncbi:MAG: phosphonate ABC transporter ATP-binding protein [Cytophagales bacterium CG12_big_fil_rev_8_21_14_0_65_40_12]|nr:MAG: phosphonate ABC transporter ATP-binding protein [Cytophagales bacterium CG12_big_fil_rev_8_21_14_0_65_40_12]PIW05760.1 MAG: phosphonate ABC transporter ATP-binding protein [Cytophagales bacterium CG17_big_fil_post_rev_8_21_14_2_50_40_13]